MDHSWLRFSTNVTIHSNHSVEDCVHSLQSLTAPANSFSRPGRLRPFRGKIGVDGGLLRFPMLTPFRIAPARSLSFVLCSSGLGTTLQGQWRLLKGIRIPVGIYLVTCILLQAFEMLRWFVFRQVDPWPQLIGPVFSFAIIYGWVWAIVALNRRSESQLIMAVTQAMEGDKSARIVGDLLSAPSLF